LVLLWLRYFKRPIDIGYFFLDSGTEENVLYRLSAGAHEMYRSSLAHPIHQADIYPSEFSYFGFGSLRFLLLSGGTGAPRCRLGQTDKQHPSRPACRNVPFHERTVKWG